MRAVMRGFQHQCFVLDADDLADKPTDGGDFVAHLQVVFWGRIMTKYMTAKSTTSMAIVIHEPAPFAAARKCICMFF